MLTIKKRALLMGALGLSLGITFAACSDDDDNAPNLRRKEYKLTADTAATAQVGTLLLTENTDSSVNLRITLNKTVKDVKHPYQLISGTTAVPGTVLYTDSITGTGNAVSDDIWKNLDTVTYNGSKRKFNYDSAVALNAFAVVKYSATKDSVIAIGNILKSAK
jgi:hypothetical protein